MLQSWNRGLVRPAKHLLSLIEPLNRKARASLSPEEFSQARYKLLEVKVAIAHNLGHWNDAIRLCKTKLRCAKQLNEWSKIMDTRISLGDLLTRVNENAAGIAELNSVLEDARAKNDHVRQARVIHHLCANAWQERDLETCVQLASQGLRLLGPDDNSLSCAQLLLSHSAAQATLGSLQPACEDLERALTILTALNQRELLSIVHCNLSEVQMWRGQWIGGIRHAEDALNLSQEMMYKSGELHANVSLAMLLLEMGQHQKSLPRSKSSIRVGSEPELN